MDGTVRREKSQLDRWFCLGAKLGCFERGIMHSRDSQKSSRARRQTGGFTLLEVLIALAILAVSLMILVSSQTTAASMTVQADRILIGTMLARQKLSDIELKLESEPGFSEQDLIEEDGDFNETFGDQYPEYRWASSIRKLDMSGATGGGLASLLGLDSEDSTPAPGQPEMPDIADMLPTDEMGETLARYIREVRVTVTWTMGDDSDEVTITTHVIKPQGPSFYDASNSGDTTVSTGGPSAGGSSGSGGGRSGSGRGTGISR